MKVGGGSPDRCPVEEGRCGGRLQLVGYQFQGMKYPCSVEKISKKGDQDEKCKENKYDPPDIFFCISDACKASANLKEIGIFIDLKRVVQYTVTDGLILDNALSNFNEIPVFLKFNPFKADEFLFKNIVAAKSIIVVRCDKRFNTGCGDKVKNLFPFFDQFLIGL